MPGRCCPYSRVCRCAPLQGEENKSESSKMKLQPQVPTCTPIYFNPIKCVAIIQRSPDYHKTSSSASPPPPWPFGGSFWFSNQHGNHQSNGDILLLPYFCLKAPSWWVSRGHRDIPPPEQSLCCPGVAGSLKKEKLVLCNTRVHPGTEVWLLCNGMSC